MIWSIVCLAHHLTAKPIQVTAKLMQESNDFWALADTITSVLVNLSVLVAAVVAVIKFRLLHMLGRRYRSELQCTHHVAQNGRAIFIGDYSVHNTGERPITLSHVTLRLHPATREGVLLVPEQQTLLAERILTSADTGKRGLFQIEAGERSIFPLRCELPELNDVVFLLCQLSWSDRRDPAPYVGMYVPSKVVTRPLDFK